LDYAPAPAQPQIPILTPTPTSTDQPEVNRALSHEPQAQTKTEAVAHVTKETGYELTNPSEQTEISEERYDPTLLAVIGILDEIKGQSNVAGWIRAGGLWGPYSSMAGAAGDISSSGMDGSTGNDAAAGTPSINLDLADENQNSYSYPETTAETTGAAEEEDKWTMWFDHEPTFKYWVRRGRGAVDE